MSKLVNKLENVIILLIEKDDDNLWNITTGPLDMNGFLMSSSLTTTKKIIISESEKRKLIQDIKENLSSLEFSKVSLNFQQNEPGFILELKEKDEEHVIIRISVNTKYLKVQSNRPEDRYYYSEENRVSFESTIKKSELIEFCENLKADKKNAQEDQLTSSRIFFNTFNCISNPSFFEAKDSNELNIFSNKEWQKKIKDEDIKTMEEMLKIILELKIDFTILQTLVYCTYIHPLFKDKTVEQQKSFIDEVFKDEAFGFYQLEENNFKIITPNNAPDEMSFNEAQNKWKNVLLTIMNDFNYLFISQPKNLKITKSPFNNLTLLFLSIWIKATKNNMKQVFNYLEKHPDKFTKKQIDEFSPTKKGIWPFNKIF